MDVVVLAGGVGGARFLLGVKAALGLPPVGPADGAPARHETAHHGPAPPGGPFPGGAEHDVTAIVNTGDDAWMHGLRICPDLDTCMYTLGGGIATERGWGRTGEGWTVAGELAAYEAEPSWFALGDKDMATHLVRSEMLRAGYPLSAVTEALCHRWAPGVRLLPMTDDRVETHVVVDDPGAGDPDHPAEPAARKALHFQEWWARYRAELPAHSIVAVGAEESAPATGAREAIARADVILLAPSNPVVSIGSILGVPGMRDALRTARAPVVGLSPIIAAAPVRGMAAACLAAIGVATTAEAVGRHYGSREQDPEGILDGWLIAENDTARVPGVAVRAVPLLMSSVEATAAMATAAIELAGVRA